MKMVKDAKRCCAFAIHCKGQPGYCLWTLDSHQRGSSFNLAYRCACELESLGSRGISIEIGMEMSMGMGMNVTGMGLAFSQ